MNRYTIPYPVYPIGIAYIGGYLERESHNVTIFDWAMEELDVLDTTLQSKPVEYIGLSFRNIDNMRIEHNENRYFMSEITELVHHLRRHSSAPVIIGGSAFSLFPEEIMALTGADFGIVGNGEKAMSRLISLLEEGASGESITVQEIPGILVAGRNGVFYKGDKNRDQLTSLYDLRPHSLIKRYVESDSMLNVQTQRGCSFSCCYCSAPIISGSSVIVRDPAEVVTEIERLVNSGAEYIWFVDSVFNVDNRAVTRLCEEILRRGVIFKWGCGLRPSGLTRQVMGIMKEAGLSHIEFGSDSFCDEILPCYGKSFRFEDIFSASALAREYSIPSAHFLILGGPEETHTTLEETLSKANSLRPTCFIPFVGMRLFPGTPLWNRAVEENLIRRDESLITPVFYVSPHLSREDITAALARQSDGHSCWITDDDPERDMEIREAKIRTGVLGPLWEFYIS